MTTTQLQHLIQVHAFTMHVLSYQMQRVPKTRAQSRAYKPS
mgnify:CR=1 FL=1